MLRHNPETAERAELEKLGKKFEDHYQRWFTETLLVVQQLLPVRAKEFEELYQGTGKRKEVDIETYNIQDFIRGYRASPLPSGKMRWDNLAIVHGRFTVQTQILETVQARFESSLFDIKTLVQADVFDSELEAAGELAKKGFTRGAGVIAGVVLEKHLKEVAERHQLKLGKKSPTISDLNDVLKTAEVIEVPTWRGIQRLGDLRNICAHNKEREPTKDEATELIAGVGKITKTVF